MFRRVYLDNSATTPVHAEVLEAMMPYLTDRFGNASSIHHFGQETRAAVDRARHQVAALINARPASVIFTSGGTESNNLAIRGLVHERSRPAHIITSAIEHPSVISVCESLEKQGARVTYLPVYDNGVVRVADVEAAIADDTVLVSVMIANNEIGTLQPVGEIGRLLKKYREVGRRIFFHTDAVQAAGKITVDVEEIGCDLLSMSAHKMHAPKGIGALYVRRGVRLEPQNVGGRQERGLRGGTEPVAQIAAMGKACELAHTALADGSCEWLRELRDSIENGVGETIPDVILNGDRESRLPNISNISFRGVEGEALLINLDMAGIAVSTGAACSSGSLEPSPVIRALAPADGTAVEDRARGAIRFSLGRFNTSEDVRRLLEVLPQAVETLRRLAPERRSTSS